MGLLDYNSITLFSVSRFEYQHEGMMFQRILLHF